MNYDWNFRRLLPYTKAFFSGTLITIELTLLVILLGTALGILIGLAMKKNTLFQYILYPIIDIIRALPPLVLILCMYYLLTVQIIGTTIEAFWVCVIAMSLNLASFTSDLVRAAIDNVPKDKIDAARALGLTQQQITRYIIFPAIIKEIIPGMTILYIGMLKMSSLASIINVREIVYSAQTVIATINRSLEAWVIVGFIYIVLVIPSTYAARRIEKWSGRGKI